MGRGLGEMGMAATSFRWIAALRLPRTRRLPAATSGSSRSSSGASARPRGRPCDPDPRTLSPLPLLRIASPGVAASAALGQVHTLQKKGSLQILTCFPLPLSQGHKEKQVLFTGSGFRGRWEPFWAGERSNKGLEIAAEISGVVNHSCF